MSRLPAVYVALALFTQILIAQQTAAQTPGVCRVGEAGDADDTDEPARCAPQEHPRPTHHQEVEAEALTDPLIKESDVGAAGLSAADADVQTELLALLAQARAAVASLDAATQRLEQLIDTKGLGRRHQPQRVQQASPSGRAGSTVEETVHLPATTTVKQPVERTRLTNPADPFVVSSTEGSVATYDGWQRLVARGRRTWPEFFSLVAAVKADGDVTAMHSMYENSYYGTFRYLVLGDQGGKLYFLDPQAHVLLEYSTGTPSAVTAITAYALDHTTTLVATGHHDGELRHHLLRDAINPETGEGIIHNVTLHAVVAHPYAEGPDEGGRQDEAEPPSIVMLDAHQQQLASSTVVVDRRGSHRMVHADGRVRFTTRSNATILAARKGRTVTAMAVADGIWVGVAPPYEHVMRKLRCIGLNGTSFVAAAFDVVRPYLLYAVTDDGQLLTLLAPTDNRVDNCTIWAQRPLALPPGRMQLLSVKSYLLLAHELGVAVFNVTAAQPKPPLDVLVEPIANLASAFGGSVQRVAQPLVGGSQAHMVAVHFGGGVVGMFTHTLPIYRPPHLNIHLWSKPIFIVVMILVGVWQFNRNSRSGARHQQLFGAGEDDTEPSGMFGAGPMMRDRGGERLDPAAIEALVRRMQAEDTKMRSQTARRAM